MTPHKIKILISTSPQDNGGCIFAVEKDIFWQEYLKFKGVIDFGEMVEDLAKDLINTKPS